MRSGTEAVGQALLREITTRTPARVRVSSSPMPIARSAGATRRNCSPNRAALTELIIETGIHDAIARKLNDKGKLSKNAVAEGIINNVRKTIIRDQLTDPRFYDQMSKLLEDLIRAEPGGGGRV